MKHHPYPIIAIALAALLGIAGCGSFAYAQKEAGIIIVSGRESANQDEDVTAQDLGVSEPRILPTNPLYVFKDIGRGFQSFFTFNPVRKAELKLQFANERLIEAKKVAERTKDPNVLKPVLESYREEVSRIKERAENIRGQANEQINQFLNHLTDQQLKHQKLLGKLEKEIPPEAFGALEQAKEKIAETMATVPLRFENPEAFQKRLEETMTSQKGSEFKNFKNLEVLKAIEEKVPEEARAAIQQAQENAKKHFQESFAQLDQAKRQQFDDYVKTIGGNEVRHVAVIQDLALADVPGEIRDVFEKAKDETFKRVQGRLKQFTDEAQKGEFLKHLENAKIEDIRIVKELEKNLPPEAIAKVLEVKAKAMAKFKDDFEAADAPDKREGFFKEMERFHDAKMTDMFQEMEKVIPAENKEFFGQMKQKAAQEMKKEIDQAGAQGRSAVLQKLAGDNPAELEAFSKFQQEFQRFGPPPAVFEEIKRQNAQNVSDRLENFQDAGRLEQFRQSIEQNDAVRKEFQAFTPNIFRQVEQRTEQLGANADPNQIRQKIKEARRALDNAEQFGTQVEGVAANDEHSHDALLKNARDKLLEAERALESGKTGEAFGKANAAFHNASNATNFLKNVSIQQGIRENKPPEFLPPEAQEKFRQGIQRERPENARPAGDEESRGRPEDAPARSGGADDVLRAKRGRTEDGSQRNNGEQTAPKNEGVRPGLPSGHGLENVPGQRQPLEAGRGGAAPFKPQGPSGAPEGNRMEPKGQVPFTPQQRPQDGSQEQKPQELMPHRPGPEGASNQPGQFQERNSGSPGTQQPSQQQPREPQQQSGFKPGPERNQFGPGPGAGAPPPGAGGSFQNPPPPPPR